jgi:undecaprenyl diphosphate synthase
MASSNEEPQETSGETSVQRGLHVGLVMDGNGRWAKRRGMPRTLGHRAGVEALKRTVQGAPDLGIEWLTVFGFSTENWSRPASEVSELMALPHRYFKSDLARLEREGVRVHVIGRRDNLKADLKELLTEAERRTEKNSRFHLQIAFNYGGRDDIVEGARRFARDVAAGRASADDLTEAAFERYLYTGDAPAPDLIVRPSGEERLSNFLLWQAAYAELVFQDVLWPDYGPDHLRAAVAEFHTRERRYGGAVVDDVLAAS